MEEVVADLLFAQAVRWRVVVDCELPYDAKVGPLSALAKTGELKVLVHLLAECGGHDQFLGQRVKNQPLRGTMRHGPSGCQGGARSAGIQGSGNDPSSTMRGIGSTRRASGLLESEVKDPKPRVKRCRVEVW